MDESQSMYGITVCKVKFMHSREAFVLETKMLSNIRSTLIASVAVAFERLDMSMEGSIQAAMLLGKMMPQEVSGLASTGRQLRPGKVGSKKRRGGPRKLHFRQKRKSRG